MTDESTVNDTLFDDNEVEMGNDPEENDMSETEDEMEAEFDDEENPENDKSPNEETKEDLDDFLDDDKKENNEDENDENESKKEKQTNAPVLTPEPIKEKQDELKQVDSKQARLIKEIASELQPQDIPTSKEFRKAVIEEAKRLTCQELGVEDFDSWDEEHQYVFSEKMEECRKAKKAKFENTVNRIQKKYAEEERIAKIENLVNSQCDTEEKKQALYRAIRGASTGYTEDMKIELAKGKTDKLQKLINLATGKKQIPQKHKPPKTNGSNSTKTRRDRGYASDLVFGF